MEKRGLSAVAWIVIVVVVIAVLFFVFRSYALFSPAQRDVGVFPPGGGPPPAGLEKHILRPSNFIKDNGIHKADIQEFVGGQWVDVCTERRTGDTCDVGSVTLNLTYVQRDPFKIADFSTHSSDEPMVLQFGDTLRYDASRGAYSHFVGYWGRTPSEKHTLRPHTFTKDNSTGISRADIQEFVGGQWVDVCTERRTGDTCDVGSVTLNLTYVQRDPFKIADFSTHSSDEPMVLQFGDTLRYDASRGAYSHFVAYWFP